MLSLCACQKIIKTKTSNQSAIVAVDAPELNPIGSMLGATQTLEVSCRAGAVLEFTGTFWGSPISSSCPQGEIYTIAITFANEGSNTIGARQFYEGSWSATTTNTFTIDIVEPTIIGISSSESSPSFLSPIPITVTFSEAVTGLSESDFTLGNATFVASSLSAGPASLYTFQVTPNGPGTVSVNLMSFSVQDLAGNNNLLGANYSIDFRNACYDNSKTYLASKSSLGVQGNGHSRMDTDPSSAFEGAGSLSGDGRFVVFYSEATNLVSDDTNGVSDVFLHDRQSGLTERVSVDSSGVQGNGDSFGATVSSDGRYVAFYSSSSNLVSGDTNGVSDVFVRDRSNQTTELISIDSNSVLGNGTSHHPAISDDGRYVAYISSASNLVTGDVNGVSDIFIRDRSLALTLRVSVDSNGVEANQASTGVTISHNNPSTGVHVVFTSNASNLVLSDTNAVSDIFVHDLDSGITERVSLGSGGIQSNGSSQSGSINATGDTISFSSFATNLVANDTNANMDIFVYHRNTGITERVSVDSAGVEGNGHAFVSSISGDGQKVAFFSSATNLVAGDTNNSYDVFVRDLNLSTTERVSITSTGAEINNHAISPAISDDGRYVSFLSLATNQVCSDVNGKDDIFIYDRN